MDCQDAETELHKTELYQETIHSLVVKSFFVVTTYHHLSFHRPSRGQEIISLEKLLKEIIMVAKEMQIVILFILCSPSTFMVL